MNQTSVPQFVVILAAGKGARMGLSGEHKVSQRIGGRAVINRAIATYREVGIPNTVVVVGHLAEQVQAVVTSEHDGILWANQAEARGTGDAARVGLQAVAQEDPLGDPQVLLVAGDRLIDGVLLERLFRQHAQQGADLTMVTARAAEGSHQGRVLLDAAGGVLAVAEWADLAAAPKDARLVYGPREHQQTFTPEEAMAAELVNVSIYLGRRSLLVSALSQLGTDNVRGEEYLSDIVNLAVRAGNQVGLMVAEDPRQVLGYNTPAELAALDAYWQTQHPVALPRPADQALQTLQRWREWLAGDDLASRANFECLYGPSEQLVADRRRAMQELVAHGEALLGPVAEVLLIRSPGRANILGRHIDHQGGVCNLLAINREILMLAHPRSDDRVTLHNLQPDRFGERSFALRELISQLPWDDWLNLVNSEQVRALSNVAQGDWVKYIKAALVRLQKRFPTQPLCGMDLVVSGDIPVAAGLSSSSALLVAAIEAVIRLNALELEPSQFVDLAGEGEWFVGTRGGSADHAAIKLSQAGQVAQAEFFPFRLARMALFPSGYELVICDSGISARKSAEARTTFNQRIASYRIGLAWLRAAFPQLAERMQYLRDVNTRTLGISLSELYRMLLVLPEAVAQRDLPLAVLEQLDQWGLQEAAPDTTYPVRGVVLYGLAECERSRLGIDLLADGNGAGFGELMNASHDGDRVVSWVDGQAVPYTAPTDDVYLLRLSDSAARDPLARASALAFQPGAYRCSTPEIDQLVDLALMVPGVVGAQLAGAGLGGCMMVLVRSQALQKLTGALENGYYRPRGLPVMVSACTPVQGSGIINPWG